ncbi:MAG: cytochrome c, partial [Rhodospirillales bacterium]|nr:cytochrome c [Rhodospirillales bacterium]
MAERLTKSAARNVFYGGSLFFLVILLGLTAQSYGYITSTSTDVKALTPAVANGKAVWEKHSCINCHTLLGEGAYFAPELANVWVRYGGDQDAQSAREALKGWMKAQPT